MHIPIIMPVQSINPVSVIAENPEMSVLPVTTPKSVTDFEDPGLEMSLAHITGQLSEMHVTPMISDEGKESAIVNKEEQPNYEKVQTITPKAPSTVAFAPSSVEAINDDMIQIVQNLDSHELEPEKESIVGDESRGHAYNVGFADSDSYYEGLTLPKKHRKQFNLDDLDVLDLGKIGESVGDELGLFGKNRKHRDNKNTKVQGEKEHNDDYDDLVDAIGHTLMMSRSDKDNKKIKKDRRRQNKMMRGEWSSQPMAS